MLLAILIPVLGEPPVLEVLPREVTGEARVLSEPSNNWFHTLFASPDLQAWEPIARFQGRFDYLDPQSALFQRRFYRLRQDPADASPGWKNQVFLEGDQFWSEPSSWMGVRWTKFIIVLDEPWRVYYQLSARYPFHYDFAVTELAAFRGKSLEQFNQLTLFRNGQQAVLGALLVPPPGVSSNEVGIQLVGRDPYPPELVNDWLQLVRRTILPRPANAFYMPVFEQRDAALEAADFFKEHGVPLGSVERWVSGDICYSSGWALGRLVFVAGNRLAEAYSTGELKPDDILLTDAVPAEVPLVGGIVSLSPATPNSHVAILANTYRQPFAYLQPTRTNDVGQLLGKDVMLVTRADELRCEVELINLDGQLDPRMKEEFARLKEPPPIRVIAKETRGTLALSADQLSPADIKYVGGKAANFGILRRAIPDHCPEAIAFTFDLWDAFLDQRMPSGQTLRSEIATRLNRHSYPPNLSALRADLDWIKNEIRRVARFDASQREEILRVLGRFDPKRNIRFRSSTNVEDTEAFTGAGLYDSYSGCLQDDLDEDDLGPCQCDPNEPEERGVFRAIQKVFASFYNQNAVIERLRHRVDENQVGMAILVHHSFPDEIELANGVATLHDVGSFRGTLVSQPGAVSVTNPGPSARAEEMQFVSASPETRFNLIQPSELLPLGARVLENDYNLLVDLLLSAAKAYRVEVGPAPRLLDFEYKKVFPGKLEIKQVRQLPLPGAQPGVVPILINQPGRWVVHQGGPGLSVFAVHRLKSQWLIETKNMPLTQSNVLSSIYAGVDWTYAGSAGAIGRLTGDPSTWPKAATRIDGQDMVTEWEADVPGGSGSRLELRVQAALKPVRDSEVPVKSLGNLGSLTLTAHYPRPISTNVFQESVALELQPTRKATDTLEAREFTAGNIRIQTKFYLRIEGGCGGCVWPFIEFAETRIRGVTAEEIRLKGYFSQSYTAEHTGPERFIFEPQLDPEINASILAELELANIRFFLVDGEKVLIMGLDRRLREVATRSF